MNKERSIFKSLKIAPRVSTAEILISSVMALIALTIVTWVSKQSLSGTNLPFILASMGATAVILFATPQSTMGRPWPLLAGHFVAAFIGISCGKLSSNLLISVPLAVGLVIFAMHYLRCIHPPGGATALLTLLGGPEISAIGYQFMLTPLAINLFILILFAYSFNKLREDRMAETNIKIPDAWQLRRQQLSQLKQQDLQAAMDSLDSYIDINTEQLAQIYDIAQQKQIQRRLGTLSCKHIMDNSPITLEYGDSLQRAWMRLSQHDDQAIVIINRAKLVEGIVTLSDFIKHSKSFEQADEQQRIGALIKPTTTLNSDKPEAVGQIMNATPICIQQDASAADAWPLFERYNMHHLPVLDSNKKLIGIINRETAQGQSFGN